MTGDLIDEPAEGEPLLVPVMRTGERVGAEALDEMRSRAANQLAQLPERLRLPSVGVRPEPYPVVHSERLRALTPSHALAGDRPAEHRPGRLRGPAVTPPSV